MAKYKPKMTRDQLVEIVSEHNPKAVLFDGLEDAYIGMSHRYGQPSLVVYSYRKIIDLYMKRDKMDYEGAVEFLEYNAMRTWAGKHTPIIVQDMGE